MLARNGYKVLLFEKKSYPLHRVCGEYVSTESENFLVSLGVNLEACPRIHELELSAPSGKMLRSKLESGGIGISRHFLDLQLYELALAAGVDIRINTSVEKVTRENHLFQLKDQKGQTYNAPLVISSHGKRSNLDREWNRTFFSQRSPYIGVKYHIKNDFPKNKIALHNFKDGYCGFSAVEGDAYCLCYLTTREQLRRHGTVRKMEEAALWRNPHLKKIWNESEFLWKEPLVINEISFAPKTRTENGILQTGDAAGMIAPLCGNGMSMALHGAKMLSGIIIQNQKLNYKEIFEQYERDWKKEFSLRLKAGRLIQGLFGAELMTNIVINSLSALPGVTKQIIRLTHGKSF